MQQVVVNFTVCCSLNTQQNRKLLSSNLDCLKLSMFQWQKQKVFVKHIRSIVPGQDERDPDAE